MISVIMACYNAENFLDPAIVSILNQTFTEFELIMVDDGSEDETIQIIERYQKQDDRIRVIHSDHGGASQARNLGIEVAKYPWIGIMDSDDIALPQRFERQMEVIAAMPQLVGLGATVHHINSRGEILSVSPLGPTTEAQFYQMRQQGHVVNLNHPTALFKKDIILKVGGYRAEFFPAEDLELMDRMAEYGPIISLPEPLLLYRVHSQSGSMQRFFFQRQVMRYVRSRHVARLEGKPEPTFEEFIQERAAWPILKRLSKYLETLAMFYYRRSGLLVGEKQYIPASFYLGLSAILNPQYTLPRIWGQVLSPQTREMVKTSSRLVK
ncbi:glycosyltransferase family 2 protein [Arthrospira platensis]|uniref:Glycosyl transferase n=1 Tax=Limnospira platensis NIES-46 TaxID=1236695 RepID=A0A5M3T311_LIMPL|nr:glycosyltransferase family 2 protein [Arthrospira platensis]AMW28505.1 glycosyl transferase family 2 [Arthrospira platensis YZ]KDR55585.1 glycosyl transferase family 2 [Arthrospira platensis str. Paraca]MBD2668675.1 glycosyltransferase family 2 protein [Arthrospira platensis FACHB-439]MBD2710102.1 glycosyltransferase family 2 protein [Arthrospira platensis FACHB-835]MDF2209716.1 glycosyltransferase family 2 protein [Arthrospira platensis NCB002]MDT9182980.1 glycosyltransferase family 2 pro